MRNFQTDDTKFTMKFRIGPVIVLMLFWLLLSGYYTVLLVVLGVLSVLGVKLIIDRMDIIDHEGQPILQFSIGLLFFHAWLLWKILQSNFIVARMILSPDPKLNPRLIELPTEEMNDMERVIYANAITLTPGTLTTEVSDERIQVHALSDATAKDLLSGEMGRRVLAIRSRKNRKAVK